MQRKKQGLRAKSGIKSGNIFRNFAQSISEKWCKSTCYIAHPIETDKRNSCHTGCETGVR